MSEDEATDDAAEAGADEQEPVDLEAIRERLDGLAADLEALESSLEAAETEDDLDVVEADLESFRAELESVEVPEPPETDDEDEEDEEPAPEEELQEQYDEIESDLSDLESDLEDQRGPYGEDVVSEIEGVSGTITGTRWTEEGNAELIEAVDSFLDELNDLLETSVTLVNEGDDVSDQLEATLDDAADAVADAGLDADDDAETIAGLLTATDDLEGGVDDATEWTDLEIREQLRREGYYDVLDHVKDFPPEWHALKVHEKQGNVEMILLALETFDSDFMEEHCMESLERMGSRAEPATDAMLQKANRRDKAAMRILGKIGVADEEVVETLVDYVDSNPNLQQPAFRALGEIGAEDAVEPIAQQLVAEEADVRSWAARALGLIGDTRAIEPLADVLADDEADRVRASAAWALNRIGTQEALEIVADYDDDRAYLVQAEAENADLEPAA
ncbi:PBS lyase HEAT domain-containing protein repeat-containing protein [Natrinema pellirubrum DSM 15624]|uniref:PBS lyase HEAT domain-containing protein repeat-containing protein n=1 Tax=Natrinema pellirubrum (strain DSM 15624 / CIP 106293 / JCM 10476 / NCIMB 786 / 157) TaxID=797303 RepID=L0JQA8_NATP1|nr:HEAT repeat domain-containing protein [Natrinema pellirubrum]AGB32571.1 PBS lyase HEAT-like repeat protein [Natrinema pellirubrum DSM 15624]ELY73707.1 PBS lyase HEAT domain-containing protein repeat-containing protein [Natrinema pellirubrum DSM 15624]